MPCAETTARTHLRKLPAVSASASVLRNLSETLANHADDAAHAARAVSWLRKYISGEPSPEELARAIQETADRTAETQRPNPDCGLCGGGGYVSAEPVFRGPNIYTQVRRCSCWSVPL